MVYEMKRSEALNDIHGFTFTCTVCMGFVKMRVFSSDVLTVPR